MAPSKITEVRSKFAVGVPCNFIRSNLKYYSFKIGIEASDRKLPLSVHDCSCSSAKISTLFAKYRETWCTGVCLKMCHKSSDEWLQLQCIFQSDTRNYRLSYRYTWLVEIFRRKFVTKRPFVISCEFVMNTVERDRKLFVER